MIAMKTVTEFCEALLSCAGRHGDAEGSEAQVGDLEDFLRAAYDLLTPEQLGWFWDDPRVAGTVREIPEYEELAAAVYPRSEPSDATDRAAQGSRGCTGSAADRSAVSIPDDLKLPVTFTHIERHGGKTYRAGGLYLSLGGGPGIGHVAMRVDPGGRRWATTDDAAAAWLIEHGLPPDRAAQLVASAIRVRDGT
jgi:hypothetical protein